MLCPEEKEEIEKLIKNGFKILNFEGRGQTVELILTRETPYSRYDTRIETITSYLTFRKGKLATEWIHYTEEIHTYDGRIKTMEEYVCESFGKLLKKLEEEVERCSF